ncbi:LysR substrate-binding domain-containing protein [Sphaerotilus mobilis]|uniref:DNA-binding transcriptional LysR family regulator n=1 Tax=Sphaerotilus mobilis TaxID=47994 RepID=A0A4Q7LDS5_9BURK|nr:LysR substrate-binding domain-containing protein [Sphaerotilus mobilis]RZS52152.1 DNA-binding transcriptional LysR family regulator [Sphaerotilus mobilis]
MIPPIHCLLAFETLARLRSVTAAGEALHITPSAVSHRIRQLEGLLGRQLFRRDFSLTAEGQAALVPVREGLRALQQLAPLPAAAPSPTRLRLAVTPTFSRQVLMPRLPMFRHAYPDIELILQVAIPLADVTAEQADLEIRYGPGGYAGVEQVCLMGDAVTPVCSPDYLHEHGPFDGFERAADIDRARLIRSPLEPWSTWFRAVGLDRAEPVVGAQFNDVGLVLDAAAAGFGVALLRLQLGAAWLDSGRLVRLSPRSVASPNGHHLCWAPGALARWECAAFVDWLTASLDTGPAGA